MDYLRCVVERITYVEGTAKFELDGKMIPVVITCRPERRKEDTFVEEALSFLRADDPY